jgi:hypothetical protein
MLTDEGGLRKTSAKQDRVEQVELLHFVSFQYLHHHRFRGCAPDSMHGATTIILQTYSLDILLPDEGGIHAISSVHLAQILCVLVVVEPVALSKLVVS